MAKRKQTDVVQLKLRLVESLRKKLEVAAKAEYRSINSEIVRRLEKSFGVDFSPSEEPGSFLERLTSGLDRGESKEPKLPIPRPGPHQAQARKIGGKS